MAKSSPKLMQRLDKCVSHLTGMSRQQAAKAIRAGDVSVDGEVLTDAAQKISLESQIVIADFNDDVEEQLSAQDAFKHRVFVLNKPYDFVCADRDKNYRLVVSLFNTELKSEQLHTAGRLDVDTTGLIIVTDDGELNHQITSPKKEVTKLYYAILDQAVNETAVQQFAKGIKHPEETKRYQPAKLILLPVDEQGRHRACVQLSEGRYHEVKRLFEMVGSNVVHLSRLAIGNLTLGDLDIAQYRSLEESELDKLFAEHDYSEQECLELIAKQEYALKHGPLTFIPESYRPERIAVAQTNAADSDATATTAVASAAAVALTAMQDNIAADPYFDENVDAELDELYGFQNDEDSDAANFEDDEYEFEDEDESEFEDESIDGED